MSWWSSRPTRSASSNSGSLSLGASVVLVTRGGNLVLDGSFSSSTVTGSLDVPRMVLRERLGIHRHNNIYIHIRTAVHSLP